MGRRLDTLDRALKRAATVLFGPQPLGYRAAVVAFGIIASWGG